MKNASQEKDKFIAVLIAVSLFYFYFLNCRAVKKWIKNKFLSIYITHIYIVKLQNQARSTRRPSSEVSFNKFV